MDQQQQHHMHGTRLGHIVPGLYFFGFGFFWAFRYSKIYLRDRSNFELTTWTPSTCPRNRARSAVLESALKIVLLVLAIVGEFQSMKRNNSRFMAAGKNADPIDFGAFNFQHIAMYSGFLFAATVELLAVAVGWNDFGRSLCYALYIFAFFNESFLFACHLHARNELDQFVHLVVVIVAFVTGIAGLLELRFRQSFIAVLFRSFCVLLQGLWFGYVGGLIHASKGLPQLKPNQMASEVMNAASRVTFYCVESFILIGIGFGLARINCFGKRLAQDEFQLLDEQQSNKDMVIVSIVETTTA